MKEEKTEIRRVETTSTVVLCFSYLQSAHLNIMCTLFPVIINGVVKSGLRDYAVIDRRNPPDSMVCESQLHG